MPQATDPKLEAVTAEAIPAGVFVCLRSTDASGQCRIATNTQADARGLLGFARRGADSGKSILLYGPGDVVPGFTGLTPGAQYWLDVSSVDLYANLSADQWTRPVGVAESATHLRLGFGDVVKVGGEADLDATETYSATTAVKVGDATNNPTVDLPGSGNVTATGNPIIDLGTSKTTVGSLGIGADILVQRVAANQAELGSGDSLNAVGSASLGIKTSSADANATIAMGSGGLVGGAGGATAADARLFRAAANSWETGDADSLHVVGAAQVGRRAATTDANPTGAITANGLELGAGGGTATDVLIRRAAANDVEIPDALHTVGAELGVRASGGDANPTAALSASSLLLGAGAGTAADFKIERAGPNQAEMGNGDSFYAVGSAAVGRKASAGDANPTTEINGNGIDFGAGGGTAVDVRLSRLAANVLGLAAGDCLQIGSVQIHAGTGAPSGNLSGALTTASGVYLRNDPAGLTTVLYVTHNTGTNWGAVTGA